eukprot:s223_g49.t1
MSARFARTPPQQLQHPSLQIAHLFTNHLQGPRTAAVWGDYDSSYWKRSWFSPAPLRKCDCDTALSFVQDQNDAETLYSSLLGSGIHPLKGMSSEPSTPPFSVGELGGVDGVTQFFPKIHNTRLHQNIPQDATWKVNKLICTLIASDIVPKFLAENHNAAHSSSTFCIEFCAQLQQNWQGSRESWWQPLLQESEAEPVWAEPSNSAKLHHKKMQKSCTAEDDGPQYSTK